MGDQGFDVSPPEEPRERERVTPEWASLFSDHEEPPGLGEPARDVRSDSDQERLQRYWGAATRPTAVESVPARGGEAYPPPAAPRPPSRSEPARRREREQERERVARRSSREIPDAQLGIPARPPVRGAAIAGIVIGGFLVVGVVLYVLARTLMGSDLGGEGAFPRDDVSAGATNVVTGVIGDPVRVGTIAVKVHEVRTVPGSAEEAPAAGMKWVAVRIEVVNEGSAEASISMLAMFDLVVADGASHAPTIIASVPKYADGDLAVGLRLTGEVVFEIPEDAEPQQFLVLAPDRTAEATIALDPAEAATP